MKSERVLRLTALALLIFQLCVVCLGLPGAAGYRSHPYQPGGYARRLWLQPQHFISPALAFLFYGVLGLLAGQYAEILDRTRPFSPGRYPFFEARIDAVLFASDGAHLRTVENIGGRVVRLGICVLLVARHRYHRDDHWGSRFSGKKDAITLPQPDRPHAGNDSNQRAPVYVTKKCWAGTCANNLPNRPRRRGR